MNEYLLFAALLGLIFAIVGFSLVVSSMRAKKRTKALHAAAGERNLAFFEQDDLGLLPSLNAFPLFSKGHGKKISNVIQGDTEDIDIYVFDYQYTTGHGNSRNTARQTVMLFRTEAYRLPSFALRPENVFHKFGSLFGYQDIDFEHAQAFSSKYLLKGEDEAAVRDLFTQNVLFTYEENPGWCAEGEADTLIVYRVSKRGAPDDVTVFMEDGIKFFALFKG